MYALTFCDTGVITTRVDGALHSAHLPPFAICSEHTDGTDRATIRAHVRKIAAAHIATLLPSLELTQYQGSAKLITGEEEFDVACVTDTPPVEENLNPIYTHIRGAAALTHSVSRNKPDITVDVSHDMRDATHNTVTFASVITIIDGGVEAQHSTLTSTMRTDGTPMDCDIPIVV